MGANMVLARARAYVPELNLEAAAGGFLELKADGSEFLVQDFAKCVKDTRPLATIITRAIDVDKYKSAYSMENQRINPPEDQPFDLVPRRHNQPFAPDIDLFVIVPGASNF
ncbi:hypothetical protein D1007_01267 [Hordeum vulgare]|nr:hypothetical protein D1007_01267 [Hordeum vulgare]